MMNIKTNEKLQILIVYAIMLKLAKLRLDNVTSNQWPSVAKLFHYKSKNQSKFSNLTVNIVIPFPFKFTIGIFINIMVA